MKNKKAGERILSIYLFIIYIIVTIGIVSGVLIFYSGLDVRETEAGVLNDKVIDCLIEQGNLKQGVLNEDFDLLNFCNFDFSSNEYGVRLELLEFDFLNELKTIEAGRDDYLEYCGLKGEKIPKCIEKEVYVLNNEESVLLKIKSVVGKTKENI